MPITRIIGQRTRVFAAIGLLVLAVAVLALGMVALGEEGEPEPFSTTPLSERHQFTDDVAMQLTLMVEGRSQEVVDLADASNIALADLTVQPGGRLPWHTHPGLGLVAILEGELVYVYADDCVERPYPAGTAFVDPGFDNVHLAFNPSETDETVAIGVFLGAPSEGALTLPVDDDQQAALDAQCGFAAAARAR